ncbi:IS3 family transposase [Streptomyces sp. NPDC050164]|uniref:IS3 family transposase n=1 Tax=Streptomyces sp. NPDC050164 TaxID=3365605 RepID=UPI0037A77040
MARSSYYAWEAGEQAREVREREDLALVHEITLIHVASKKTYGVPRVTAELHRWGHLVNRKRVERLMREDRIAGHSRRTERRSLTRADRKAAPAPDLIGRDFSAPARACAWSATSPTSPPPRAGCTWRSGSIWRPVR